MNINGVCIPLPIIRNATMLTNLLTRMIQWWTFLHLAELLGARRSISIYGMQVTLSAKVNPLDASWIAPLCLWGMWNQIYALQWRRWNVHLFSGRHINKVCSSIYCWVCVCVYALQLCFHIKIRRLNILKFKSMAFTLNLPWVMEGICSDYFLRRTATANGNSLFIDVIRWHETTAMLRW